MKNDSNEFCVWVREKAWLKEWPTRVKQFSKSKMHYGDILAEYVEKLSALQDLLYAHNRESLLLVFPSDERGQQGERDRSFHK